MLLKFFILAFCSLVIVSPHSSVRFHRIHKFAYPEHEVRFFLYHRSDLTREDQIYIGDKESLLMSRFDPNLPTRIIIHGWTQGKDAHWLVDMREAMAVADVGNIIVVDWSPLSRAQYTQSRFYTVIVGKQVAEFLLFLNRYANTYMWSVHLIGHSMGAQITAMAGHNIQLITKEKVGRITGLDPAAPLYEWPHVESLDEILDPSDAIFVDVIHTNARHLGMAAPAGHVDYYPNGGERQEGCLNWVCSHTRACEYWTASVRNPYIFKAYLYRSWKKYLNGYTNSLESFPMGIAANSNIPQGMVVGLRTDDKDYDRKSILEEEEYNATNFLTLWDFEGVFKYSPLFYGWYTNKDSKDSKYKFYRLPFAYFVTGLVVYAYSFVATLRKMAENSRMSKLSEKDDECIFSWKLFTSWDYMIGNAETAHNRVASIVMGFKEALLEEAEKKRESRNWKVVCFRVFVNLVVLGLLTFSAFAVVMVVKRSTEEEANSTVWRKNEITIVMSLISLFFPMLFEVLGLLEQYHPRKQLRLQLARIMVLNLLNLYSLIFALFDKISSMTNELQNYKNISCMKTTTNIYSTTTSSYSSIVFEDVKENMMPISDSLVYDLYPPLVTTLKDIMREAVTDLGVSNVTSSTLFPDEYLDNSSIFNITENISFNLSFSNISFFNETLGNFTDYDIAEIKDFILDYLTNILFNNSNTDFNIFNSTEVGSANISNRGYTDVNEDKMEVFKTTMIPLLMNISKTTIAPLLMNISKNYETGGSENLQDLTTAIYNEISTPDYPLASQNLTSTIIVIFQPPTTVSPNSTNEFAAPRPTSSEIVKGNYAMCARLRSLCWETMFGQELIKLTVMDLIMTILSTLAIDFFRGIFVRVMNRCWCWDLEKKFPQYGDFKVAENILHLVNNQGMVWMGMFFSPGLVVFNVIKLYIMMYFRAWAVLTCNVPHEVIFRASRSNNFYYALLLMMLFLCVLPVGYAIVRIKPSWHCGPFSKYDRIFYIFTESIRNIIPRAFHDALDYIASPGIIIPLLVLLTLIIYYLISLTGALREANEDLKIQLRRERTEERRKMFQIVDRRRGASGESNELSNTPFAKWKKLLGTLPSGKSFEDTSKQQSDEIPQPLKEEKVENKGKDFLTKFIKKALRKSSISEEEQNAGDGTDTEQHDSLPYDPVASKQLHKPVKPSLSWNSDFHNVVSRAVKSNQRRLSNVPCSSVDSNDTKHVLPQRHDTFELKYKFSERTMPSTSKDMRQDSASSVWSDNIPVITISKTESAENILIDAKTNVKTEKISKTDELSKFKPKVKCALKKQSTEYDEDTICHFNEELEKNLKDKSFIKSVSEEDIERLPINCGSSENNDEQPSEKLSDQSSSEDTEFRETSIGTILNFPIKNAKLFSSGEQTVSDDTIEHLT